MPYVTAERGAAPAGQQVITNKDVLSIIARHLRCHSTGNLALAATCAYEALSADLRCKQLSASLHTQTTHGIISSATSLSASSVCGTPSETAQLLAHLLPELPQLRHLALEDLDFSDGDIRMLFPGVVGSLTALTSLTLTGCISSAPGAAAIACTLPRLPHLLHLNLSDNWLRDSTAVLIAAAAPNLHSLSLAGNCLCSAATTLIRTAASFRHLRALSIGGNDIVSTHEAAPALQAVLPLLTRLTLLHLPAVCDVLDAAADFLQPIQRLTALRDLDVRRNHLLEVPPESVHALAWLERLERLRGLTRLALEDEEPSDEGEALDVVMVPLARGLSRLVHLQELVVPMRQHLDTWLALLGRLHHLTALNFGVASAGTIPPPSLPALHNLLHRHSGLRNLAMRLPLTSGFADDVAVLTRLTALTEMSLAVSAQEDDTSAAELQALSKLGKLASLVAVRLDCMAAMRKERTSEALLPVLRGLSSLPALSTLQLTTAPASVHGWDIVDKALQLYEALGAFRRLRVLELALRVSSALDVAVALAATATALQGLTSLTIYLAVSHAKRLPAGMQASVMETFLHAYMPKLAELRSLDVRVSFQSKPGPRDLAAVAGLDTCLLSASLPQLTHLKYSRRLQAEGASETGEAELPCRKDCLLAPPAASADGRQESERGSCAGGEAAAAHAQNAAPSAELAIELVAAGLAREGAAQALWQGLEHSAAVNAHGDGPHHPGLCAAHMSAIPPGAAPSYSSLAPAVCWFPQPHCGAPLFGPYPHSAAYPPAVEGDTGAAAHWQHAPPALASCMLGVPAVAASTVAFPVLLPAGQGHGVQARGAAPPPPPHAGPRQAYTYDPLSGAAAQGLGATAHADAQYPPLQVPAGLAAAACWDAMDGGGWWGHYGPCQCACPHAAPPWAAPQPAAVPGYLAYLPYCPAPWAYPHMLLPCPTAFSPPGSPAAGMGATQHLDGASAYGAAGGTAQSLATAAAGGVGVPSARWSPGQQKVQRGKGARCGHSRVRVRNKRDPHHKVQVESRLRSGAMVLADLVKVHVENLCDHVVDDVVDPGEQRDGAPAAGRLPGGSRGGRGPEEGAACSVPDGGRLLRSPRRLQSLSIQSCSVALLNIEPKELSALRKLELHDFCPGTGHYFDFCSWLAKLTGLEDLQLDGAHLHARAPGGLSVLARSIGCLTKLTTVDISYARDEDSLPWFVRALRGLGGLRFCRSPPSDEVSDWHRQELQRVCDGLAYERRAIDAEMAEQLWTLPVFAGTSWDQLVSSLSQHGLVVVPRRGIWAQGGSRLSRVRSSQQGDELDCPEP